MDERILITVKTYPTLSQTYGDESLAIEKVKQKYLDDFARKRDLHLFVGTTKQYHGWASTHL